MWLTKKLQAFFRVRHESFRWTHLPPSYWENRPQGTIRACSHEPGTVNYPGVMIAPGKALLHVHMMICFPGAMLPQLNFIAPGQIHRHLITTNLSEFL